MGDLMAELLERGSLAQLGGAGRVLDLVLVHVILGSFEVHRELGVVGQRLVLGVVLVQIEVVVVRYVGVGLDRGYVPGRPGLAPSVEVELRLRETGVRVRTVARGQLLAESLVQGSLALKTTLQLSYPRVDRRHLRLPLRQGQPLLGHHLVLLLVHLVAVLPIAKENRFYTVSLDQLYLTGIPFRLRFTLSMGL